MAPFKVEFNVLYVDAQSNYPLGMESDNRFPLYNLIIYIYIHIYDVSIAHVAFHFLL